MIKFCEKNKKNAKKRENLMDLNWNESGKMRILTLFATIS
jgi:hypothetical protein